MGNKISDLGKRVFLSYLNDDNQIISGFVILLDCSDFVTFRTDQNIIRIPIHRVLKIKEKLE